MSCFLIYLAVSCVPSAAWLWWIRRRDVYEPEPVGLMLSTFARGMGAAVLAIVLERILMALLLPQTGGFKYIPGAGSGVEALVYCFLVVAPVEEYLKYRAVRTAAYQSSEFNEPMDGIVYMVCAAAGFATLENALYMQGFGAWVLALRMVLSTFLHVACSGILGYHLGLARFHERLGRRLLLQGFLIAIGLHGAYDFFALYQPGAGLLALGMLFAVLYWLRERLMEEIERALEKSPFRPRRTLVRLRPAVESSPGSGPPIS